MTGSICIETETQFHSIEFETCDKEKMYEEFVKLKKVAKDFGADLDNEFFQMYLILPSKMNQPGFDEQIKKL